MKNTFCFIFILCFCSLTVLAGELKIIPDKPADNSTVSFSYAPDGEFKPDDRVYAYVYTFNAGESLPKLNIVTLNYSKSAKTFTGTLVVPPEVIYAMVKTGNFDRLDKNGNNFWDFFVAGANGAVKKGAYRTASMTYLGGLPENYSRNVDFARALDYLQKENEIYTDDISSKIALYSLQLDMKKITKNEFEKNIGSVLPEQLTVNDESNLVTITRALRAVNKADRADRLESDFIAAHPESRLAEEKRFAAIAKAKTFVDFSDKILSFIRDYPQSSKKEKVFGGLVSGFIQRYNYQKMLGLLDSLDNIPPSAYLNLANEVADHDKILKDSSDLFRKAELSRLIGLAIARAGKDNALLRPPYMTEAEWDQSRRSDRASVYESVGDIFVKQGALDSAGSYYSDAVNFLGDNTSSKLFTKFLDILDRQNKDEQAFRISEQAILLSVSTPEIEALNKKVYSKLKAGAEGYDAYLTSIQKTAKDRRLQKLKAEMISITPELGYLETLDGMTIDMRAFKGNVIIVNFFSTWCEPCDEQIEALDSIREKYSSRQDLIILPVNIWENLGSKKQDVKTYIKESGTQLPVYTDPKESLPQKMGVTGLPTTIFIDKSGRIRFKEAGFDSENSIIREIDDRLEVLFDEKM